MKSMSNKRLPSDLGLRIGATEDLPDVLKRQLKKSALTPTLENDILEVVHYLGGVCSTDELIVGLWRRHSVLTDDRKLLAAKLYRMTRKGSLSSVSGRRGIWAFPEVSASINSVSRSR